MYLPIILWKYAQNFKCYVYIIFYYCRDTLHTFSSFVFFFNSRSKIGQIWWISKSSFLLFYLASFSLSFPLYSFLPLSSFLLFYFFFVTGHNLRWEVFFSSLSGKVSWMRILINTNHFILWLPFSTSPLRTDVLFPSS